MLNKIEEWYNRFYEKLWRLLPDKCDFRGTWICSRKGVRGNENIVHHPKSGKRLVLCDNCSVRLDSIYYGQDVDRAG